MVQKSFCDICGKPASRIQEYFRVTVADKVECDEKARIEMAVHTSFKGHSSGFGGPPDMCSDCFIQCLETVLESAMRNRRINAI